MAVSRREFLQRGTMLAAGAALPFQRLRDLPRGGDGDSVDLPGAPHRGAAGAIRNGDLLNMTVDSFAPLVNSGFTVQVGAQKLSMILLSATQLPPPAPPSNLASFAVMPPAVYFAPSPLQVFTLSFRGPADI